MVDYIRSSNNNNSNLKSMNKLIEIQKFAQEKLEEWCLAGIGWKFVWDNKATCRYGQCRYYKKEIGITKKLASINTIEESQDVVLHEIAHALTGSGHGHDAVWKRMCIKVGARPERCYSSEENGGTVKTIKGKWKLINKDTGEVYRHYHRKPRRQRWDCIWLTGRKKETYGKLQVVANKLNNPDSSPYKIQS
jgi:predicted SprT family Zn-dependent metalloprotease